MKLLRTSLAIGILGIAQPAFAQDAHTSPPADTANDDRALDRLALPEQQLREFLMLASFRTATVTQFVYLSGVEEHCERFAPIFNRAVNSYLPRWSANLRDAYREVVPAETLRNAVEKGPRDGAMLIAPYRDQIGKKMQEESTPLLKSATLSVVKDVAAAMPQTSVDSIDSEARE